jgi:hypothetical protein
LNPPYGVSKCRSIRRSGTNQSEATAAYKNGAAEKQRRLTLPILANGLAQAGLGSLGDQDQFLQDPVGKSRCKQDAAVEQTGTLLNLVFAHPGGGKRQEGQPKQHVQVHPEDSSRHQFASLQQVMTVIPIDANINKAQFMAPVSVHGQHAFNQRGSRPWR